MTVRYSFLWFRSNVREVAGQSICCLQVHVQHGRWGHIIFFNGISLPSRGRSSAGHTVQNHQYRHWFPGEKTQLNNMKYYSKRKAATVQLKIIVLVCNYIDNKEIVIYERWKHGLNIDQYSLVILSLCVIYVCARVCACLGLCSKFPSMEMEQIAGIMAAKSSLAAFIRVAMLTPCSRARMWKECQFHHGTGTCISVVEKPKAMAVNKSNIILGLHTFNVSRWLKTQPRIASAVFLHKSA